LVLRGAGENLVREALAEVEDQVASRVVGDVDLAIWPDLVTRAIRNAALATPGLERAFVLGLVGWLHVELLFHFRESEALNRGIT
jgi:hypothetical protein